MFCHFFVSLDSHSDGTHSLQRIHWWASDVMIHFSKSVLMKKLTQIHVGWTEVEYNLPCLGELFCLYSNQNGSVLLPCILSFAVFFAPFFLQKVDNIFVETLL